MGSRISRGRGISCRVYLSSGEMFFPRASHRCWPFCRKKGASIAYARKRKNCYLAIRIPKTRPTLFGLMVGVKDIFHADGFSTQAGSQLPSEELQGPQAESVSKLKDAGALVLGKLSQPNLRISRPVPRATRTIRSTRLADRAAGPRRRWERGCVAGAGDADHRLDHPSGCVLRRRWVQANL